MQKRGWVPTAILAFCWFSSTDWRDADSAPSKLAFENTSAVVSAAVIATGGTARARKDPDTGRFLQPPANGFPAEIGAPGPSASAPRRTLVETDGPSSAGGKRVTLSESGRSGLRARKAQDGTISVEHRSVVERKIERREHDD